MAEQNSFLPNKRDSILTARDSLLQAINDKFNALRVLWNQVGMSEEQRHERMTTAVMHVENLLSEMLHEEREMFDTLTASVLQLERVLHALCAELQIDVDDPGESLGLLDIQTYLQQRCEELKIEKKRRVQILEELQIDDLFICSKLGIERYQFLPDSSGKQRVLPSDEQLADFRAVVEKNRAVLEDHRSRLEDYKRDICALAKKLNYTPQNEVERKVLSEPIQSLPLTDAFLSDVEQLEFTLQEKYAAHLEAIRQQMTVVEAELRHWWDVCHCTEAERQKFSLVSAENFDELALKKYRREIDRLKTFYKERKDVLDKVDLWKQLWDQKVSYEEKDKDTNRLLNRGGALLQEERERKRLEKRLPVIKSELKLMVDEWKRSHNKENFVLNGVDVVDHITNIETEYQTKKEFEKAAKQLAKKQQVENERLYGVSPVTPNKKRPIFQTSGRTTPTVNAAPLSSSRHYVHSSLAVTRSPMGSTNRLAPAASRPAGLPPPVPGPASMKRKAESNVAAAAVDCLQPSKGTANVAEAPTTEPEYQRFAAECLGKGFCAQSSFIQGGSSPTKILRL